MADEEYLEEAEELEGQDEFYDEEDDSHSGAGSLSEALAEQMRALPWYLASTGAHAIILLILMLIPTALPQPPRKKVVIQTTVQEPEVKEEEEDPLEEPDEENPLQSVMAESSSAVSTSDVASDINVDTNVEINTDISVEETEETVGDPSEEEIADADDDAAPSVMGIRGRFSAGRGVSSGFRGGFGKIGRGLRGMIGGGGGGGGSSRGLCLVWLLDQSGSMKDDQEALARQARDIQELLTDGGRKRMVSAVVTYGQNWSITQEPTREASQITDAILNVDIDASGIENTNQAIIYTCDAIMSKYRGWTKVIVLLTDENASDDRMFYSPPKPNENRAALKLSASERKIPLIEAALKTLRSSKTRLFVIGKEAPFQMASVWERYVDAEGRGWTLSASRGPETPGVEVPVANTRNFDYHNRGNLRDDYVKSGYGMYCHAYLAKYSKGAYFILDESDTGSQKSMSPSERARYPMRVDWGIMDHYKPLIISRLKYKEALLSLKYGRKVWQLNEYLRENRGKIGRANRCYPPNFQKAREALRNRKKVLVKLIDVIGDTRASESELENLDQRRQAANIDLYYCVLLADQMITDAFLDAFEKYRGSTAPAPKGFHATLVIHKIAGSELSQEQKQLFDERMIKLTEACNEVIRRHSNTPFALAAFWTQRGPREWGVPLELKRHEGKHNPNAPKGPPRPKM